MYQSKVKIPSRGAKIDPVNTRLANPLIINTIAAINTAGDIYLIMEKAQVATFCFLFSHFRVVSIFNFH